MPIPGVRLALAVGLGVLAAGPAFAQQTPAQASATVRIGTLRCDAAASTGFIFGSTRELNCTFTPANGAVERYRGEIRRFGVDIGFTSASVMLWGVLATAAPVQAGALAGSYVGASAAAAVGVGGAANILVGGGASGISLQPLSVEGSTGLNIALGVGELRLEPG